MSESATRRKKSVGSATTSLQGGAHILLADPNAASREVCEQQLRSAGYRVSVARTPFETIVKACCLVPDLILLATSLGHEAGETSELLTSCPVTAHIPVVRVSAGRPVPRRALSDLRRAAS